MTLRHKSNCRNKLTLSSEATSFSRNVISSNRRFAEMQFCRIVVLPQQKIAESDLTEASHGRTVKLAKLYNADRHFSESFRRTSFLRFVVQPNVVFPKHLLPERHSAEQ